MAKKLDPALLIWGEAVDRFGELNEIEAEQVEGALGFAELAFKALTLSVMVDRAQVKVLEAIGERGGYIASSSLKSVLDCTIMRQRPVDSMSLESQSQAHLDGSEST